MTDEVLESKIDIPSPVLDVTGRDVTMLFSVDNPDRGGDICPPSAFRRSIKSTRDIPHLWMHEVEPSIGNIRSFAEVKRHELPQDVQAEYPDATGGMSCVSTIIDFPRANELLAGIKAGTNYGCSFGYAVRDATPITLPDGRKGRRLNEVRLIEVSSTSPGMAMNLATRVRLGKLDTVELLLAEYKAGRRHGEVDMERLRRIAVELIGLGADNITLLTPDHATQEPARSSDLDALIADLGTYFEVES